MVTTAFNRLNDGQDGSAVPARQLSTYADALKLLSAWRGIGASALDVIMQAGPVGINFYQDGVLWDGNNIAGDTMADFAIRVSWTDEEGQTQTSILNVGENLRQMQISLNLDPKAIWTLDDRRRPTIGGTGAADPPTSQTGGTRADADQQILSAGRAANASPELLAITAFSIATGDSLKEIGERLDRIEEAMKAA